MVDYRYHLTSLMAVFLALGIGMLIGNSFVGLASVESQNRALRQLQQDVSAVRKAAQASHQENAALRQYVKDRDRALWSIAPRVVDGILKDRRVALLHIGTPKQTDITTELSNVLTSAGAEVVSTTLIQRNWLPNEPQSRASVLEALEVYSGEKEVERATRTLARALITGNWSGALQKVSESSPGLTLDGDYTSPVGSVVLIDNTDHPNEALLAQSENSLESLILQTMQDAGIRLVAAEPEETQVSMISFFDNRGVATVDNIDTAIGQVACAMALVVGKGRYGTKPTADRLLPEIDTLAAAAPS